ncbi:MAG: hypothetical protein OHK0023_23310 [Anaerolineae bacterium]
MTDPIAYAEALEVNRRGGLTDKQREMINLQIRLGIGLSLGCFGLPFGGFLVFVITQAIGQDFGEGWILLPLILIAVFIVISVVSFLPAIQDVREGKVISVQGVLSTNNRAWLLNGVKYQASLELGGKLAAGKAYILYVLPRMKFIVNAEALDI